MNRRVPFITAGILLGGFAVQGWAAESDVLRRLQELENEIARLRAELGATKPIPVKTKATAGSEWDEPDIDKKPEGRDEEARRRLLVIETQSKKNTAETIKREEAQKDRVQFDFSGKYRAQANTRHNFQLNSAQQWKYDDTSFVDHKYSLQIDASYDALLARLVLDKGNFVMDWKEDGEGTQERWGQFQTMGSQNLVRELFVQYTGPFMVRAGRQTWDVGQKIVLDGPMDGLRLQVPFGQLPWGQTTLSAGYMAVAGGWGSYTKFNASGGRLGGSREEVFSASNKLNAWYADLDIRPTRGVRLLPYVIKLSNGGSATDADLNLDKDFNAATMPRDGSFQPMWTGLSASAEFGKWKFDGEAVLLSGDYTATRKLSGNALLLKAAHDFGKVSGTNLSTGLQFGRGSGNGTDDTGTMKNFNALFMCRERHKFGNIFSEDVRAGYYFWDSNLSNITYLRMDATLEPRHGLKFTPSFTRIWTTNSVFAGRGPVFDWSQGASTSTVTTKDVGWEVDLDVTFPIQKRLEGFVSLGYFRPGTVYAKPDGSKSNAATEVVVGAEFKF